MTGDPGRVVFRDGAWAWEGDLPTVRWGSTEEIDERLAALYAYLMVESVASRYERYGSSEDLPGCW